MTFHRSSLTVRLIDALDRNGAINLVVSISIMAIPREEHESDNAKGMIGERGARRERERERSRMPDERITFPNDRPGNFPRIIWYRLRLACAACVDPNED